MQKRGVEEAHSAQDRRPANVAPTPTGKAEGVYSSLPCTPFPGPVTAARRGTGAARRDARPCQSAPSTPTRPTVRPRAQPPPSNRGANNNFAPSPSPRSRRARAPRWAVTVCKTPPSTKVTQATCKPPNATDSPVSTAAHQRGAPPHHRCPSFLDPPPRKLPHRPFNRFLWTVSPPPPGPFDSPHTQQWRGRWPVTARLD